MSTISQSHMVAGSKVIIFTGKPELWLERRKTLDPLFSPPAVLSVLTRSSTALMFDEERQEEWQEKVEKSVGKARDKRACAWNLLHQAARTYFKSIVKIMNVSPRTHEFKMPGQPLSTRWKAEINKQSRRCTMNDSAS